ncbi:MAG: ROK family protein, partial [Flavobacterium sp.]
KGRAYRNFVGLSIGTGLGMGVIINHQLYNGVMCGAGEIGMLPYLDGIVEEYAASFFFTRNYGENARTLHEYALRDQPQAIEAFHKFGHHLGEAIKMILFMFAPEAIILGGSIAKAHKLFEASLKESIAQFAYPRQTEGLHILVSTHPNLAILGASALVMDPPATSEN